MSEALTRAAVDAKYEDIRIVAEKSFDHGRECMIIEMASRWQVQVPPTRFVELDAFLAVKVYEATLWAYEAGRRDARA